MKMIKLGRTGLDVSRICLGMMTYGSPEWRAWVLDEAAARPLVRRAVEAGVNFSDTADMYSNGAFEITTGKLLKEFAKREEIVIATIRSIAGTRLRRSPKRWRRCTMS